MRGPLGPVDKGHRRDGGKAHYRDYYGRTFNYTHKINTHSILLSEEETTNPGSGMISFFSLKSTHIINLYKIGELYCKCY